MLSLIIFSRLVNLETWISANYLLELSKDQNQQFHFLAQHTLHMYVNMLFILQKLIWSYCIQYPPSWFSCGADAVPGPEVPVKILQHNIANAATPEEAKKAREQLDELMKNRKFMEGVVHDVIDVITNDVGLTNTIFTENVELTQ